MRNLPFAVCRLQSASTVHLTVQREIVAGALQDYGRARLVGVTIGLIQSKDEMRGVHQVLNAAALTYVAGLVTALLQLLYYVTLVGGFGRRRR